MIYHEEGQIPRDAHEILVQTINPKDKIAGPPLRAYDVGDAVHTSDMNLPLPAPLGIVIAISAIY